jgi:hypothetical protein
MLTYIQAVWMAQASRRRVARILREIDAPREQAIKEARLSAEQYREAIRKEGLGWASVGTAKTFKRGRYSN